MNYQRIYDEIVHRGIRRGWSKGSSEEAYIELHHILPKCMGGCNAKSNIVALTGREHYLAHWLLYKIHKLPKLANAWHRMCSNQSKGLTYTSKSFEYARVAHANAVRIQATGRIMSPEARAKISLGNSGKVRTEEMNEANRLRRLGTTHSAESIEKCRIASTGRIHTEETIEKQKLIHRSRKSRPVRRTDSEGSVKIYEFLPIVSDEGFSAEQVRRCCSPSYPGRVSYKKFQWEYADEG